MIQEANVVNKSYINLTSVSHTLVQCKWDSSYVDIDKLANCLPFTNCTDKEPDALFFDTGIDQQWKHSPILPGVSANYLYKCFKDNFSVLAKRI